MLNLWSSFVFQIGLATFVFEKGFKCVLTDGDVCSTCVMDPADGRR